MLVLCIRSRSFLCTVCSKVSDSLMLALCILSCSFLCTVCSKVSDSWLPYTFCFVPAYAVCSKDSDSLMLAIRILFCSCLSTVCSKVSDSLMLAIRNLFCSCLCTVCSKVSDSCACHTHSVVSAYAKFHSRVSDTLSQALYNLSSAFLADFTLSNSTALIRFKAFSRKLHSAFRLDRKT